MLSDVVTPENKGYRRKPGHMVGNVRCRTERPRMILVWEARKLVERKMSTGSHFELAFLHKPIVYGVASLLYGVATLDSMVQVS